MKSKTEQTTSAKLLLKRLDETRLTFYESNEKKAEMIERRLSAYERWSEQVEIYLLKECEVQDGNR